jgi:hypothetical protein
MTDQNVFSENGSLGTKVGDIGLNPDPTHETADGGGAGGGSSSIADAIGSGDDKSVMSPTAVLIEGTQGIG